MDDALHALEARGIINITMDHLTHKITPVDRNHFPRELEEGEKKAVFDVLSNFGKKSAADLEAYTTLDYVAHTMLGDEGTEEQVIQDVLTISGYETVELYLLNPYGKCLKKRCSQYGRESSDSYYTIF